MRAIFTSVIFFTILSGLALSQDTATLRRTADSLYFNSRYPEALVKYKDLVKASADTPAVAYPRIAFCNHYLGNYNEAMAMYKEVLKKKISTGLKMQVFSRMAMILAVKSDKGKAFAYLDSALSYGYLNVWELENFKDFDNIRNDTTFREICLKTQMNAYPCRTRPEAHLFDFWIGDWDVFNNQYPNQRVGTSRIQSVSGECTILENYQAHQFSFSGKSQNWYDPNTKKWTQLWIGSSGGHQYFTDGEYKDGAMRFKYQTQGQNGLMQSGNFIFYNLGPDKVRQYQEISGDSGKTQRVVYDFIYLRKKNDGEKIRELNNVYAKAWLASDEKSLLELFDENATLSTINIHTGKPIRGRSEIKNFWFPADNSKITILDYTNEMIGLYVEGDIAQSTHQSYVKWVYEKNGKKELKEQKGYGSAVYKKQPDGEWKYFHLMSDAYKKAALAIVNREKDEEAIRDINRKYVTYWLKNDEKAILSLFTPDASIAPSGMKTFKGIKEIAGFWFPQDGSVTKILKFNNDIQNIHFDRDIAETSQVNYLFWTYKNGNQELKREQWGFATTIYKKQKDGKWKIIHQMWKDYKMKDL